MLKSTYIMLIGSAGGEKSALSSTNASYMTNVVEHINWAITVVSGEIIPTISGEKFPTP